VCCIIVTMLQVTLEWHLLDFPDGLKIAVCYIPVCCVPGCCVPVCCRYCTAGQKITAVRIHRSHGAHGIVMSHCMSTTMLVMSDLRRLCRLESLCMFALLHPHVLASCPQLHPHLCYAFKALCLYSVYTVDFAFLSVHLAVCSAHALYKFASET